VAERSVFKAFGFVELEQADRSHPPMPRETIKATVALPLHVDLPTGIRLFALLDHHRHLCGNIQPIPRLRRCLGRGNDHQLIVVGIARLVGGQSVTKRQILFASIAYSVFVSLVLCALGLGLGDGFRAI